MWTDTHAHLCDAKFDTDRSEMFRRAAQNTVHTIVEIADSPADWSKASALCSEQSVKVHWSCGFHPHYAQDFSEEKIAQMTREAASPGCVAIGEIGLDYFKSTASKEDQQKLFRRALETASELNKPVVIHCRDAQADTLRILRSFFSGLARRDLCIGVIHCFSGDISFAEGCLDLGFMLGVDGPLTYPGAKALREVIAQVPLDKIVLETDSPYLPPQEHRGQRNEPSYLPMIGARLSELFQKSPDEIAQTTTSNAQKLFRLYDR